MNALPLEVFIFSVDVVDEDRVVGICGRFPPVGELALPRSVRATLSIEIRPEYDPFLVADAKEGRAVILVLQLDPSFFAVERAHFSRSRTGSTTAFR